MAAAFLDALDTHYELFDEDTDQDPHAAKAKTLAARMEAVRRERLSLD